MSVDYIVASLPPLAFGAPAPMSWEKFLDACGDAGADVVRSLDEGKWRDIETQLRNAVAEARGGAKWKREARGCSVYWKNRVLACFQESDVARRDEMVDRVWWDAAGELADVASPLGRGALCAYAARLRIALRRSLISTNAGNAAFDRLTAETKRDFS